ncbi:YbaB/EbfC family nucleoid-associated protein [Wolbachia endosymbiont of Pentidionis agamae]|uniref:YbaB/EbfC family nucleoid-associated protein n=1 Tax=Wolbachia endosymbiont of Pentidionis agamae TaxID=3110435 RepID=UPI0038CD210C
MDFNQIMKQMQSKMEEFQSKEFLGISGGGQVSVLVVVEKIGSYRVKNIDTSKLPNDEEEDVRNDLIVAAFNSAMKKAEEEMAGNIAGMMLPPGFKLPF